MEKFLPILTKIMTQKGRPVTLLGDSYATDGTLEALVMTGIKESLISKFAEGTYVSPVTVPTMSKDHHRILLFHKGDVHGS